MLERRRVFAAPQSGAGPEQPRRTYLPPKKPPQKYPTRVDRRFQNSPIDIPGSLERSGAILAHEREEPEIATGNNLDGEPLRS